MAGQKNRTATASQSPTAAGNTPANKPVADKAKWLPAAILLLTALLYLKATGNGFTFMDDDFYILKNPFIRDFSWHGVAAIFTSFNNYNYHPLTTLTDLLIFKWSGLNPFPYHLLNVALHVVNTWLVYRLAKGLSGNNITGLVVAVLFAVHPLHVESVAWVSERKDVLYTAFYLSSLLLYLKYLVSGFKAKYYTGTLLLFLAALFSKSAAVTLPLLLIAIDYYKGRKINAKSLSEKIPFLLLSVVFGILAILSQSSGGAMSDLSHSFSFINRVFLFTSGLAFYIIKLAAPFGLNAMHFFPDITGGVLPWYYYASLPFLLVLAWLIAHKNAYRKEILFGIAFFLITISVMLQLVPVGASLVAERYTYIPYIGLFYIAGQWLSANYLAHRKIIVPAFTFIIILFTVQSWLRIDTWKDTDTLFTDITEKNPGNWRDGMVYNSWGDFEKYNGDNNSALQKYTEAIRLFPGYALAWYNRGNTYTENRDAKAALNDYNEAILLNPGKAQYYSSRGWAYYQSGDKQAALADYNKAIAIDPEYAETYNNRGWAYYEAGDIKSSLSNFNKAITLAPGFPKPYYNRASINANSGNLAVAIDDYNTLLKINRNDSLAYFDRGIIRLNQKDMHGACEDWKKSMELGYKGAQGMLQQYCR